MSFGARTLECRNYSSDLDETFQKGPPICKKNSHCGLSALSVCLSGCPFVYLPVCLSMSMLVLERRNCRSNVNETLLKLSSVCLENTGMAVRLSACMSVCFSVCLIMSVCIFVLERRKSDSNKTLQIWTPIIMSWKYWVLSVCLSVCQSDSVSICLCVCFLLALERRNNRTDYHETQQKWFPICLKNTGLYVYLSIYLSLYLSLC